MNIILTLFIMLILLLLKGFFSGSEIALVSTDRPKLRHKAASGHKGAKLAFNMLAIPERLLATTLLGTNISSIALTTVGTLLMVELFGGHSGEIAAIVIFTPIFLIFGEIVPKSIYQQKADVLAPIIIYPLRWLQTLLMPLIWILSKIAAGVAGLLGKGQDPGDTEREQVMALVNMAESSGDIVAFEKGQVRRVFQFAQMTVGEVMQPLSEMTVLSENSKMKKLIQLRKDKGQQLIPLYQQSPSDITSVVQLTVWDILDDQLASRSIAHFKCEIKYAPSIQPLSEIIEVLREHPEVIIIVVDDIGQSLGMITLQQLVLLTLGKDKGIHEGRNLTTLEQDESGSYLLDARLPVISVSDALNIHLPTLTYATIGGYALAQLGHIPKAGESFVAEGFVFTVTETSEKAILALKAKRK